MNDKELLRYSRQIMLPEIDVSGQEKILSAHVAIIGLGGLGSPVALYLASAGVGQLTLVDDDVVDETNLQRQIAHVEENLGEQKTLSAQQAISRVNSSTAVTPIAERITYEQLVDLASSADVLVDGTDNFSTRFDVNEASVTTQTPLVSGAAIRMEGQVAVFDPREPTSPCYRCLYREATEEPLNCAENGVMAPLVGIIGSGQAMETLNLICEYSAPSSGWVQYLDAKRMEWRKLKLPKSASCPSCGPSARSQRS